MEPGGAAAWDKGRLSALGAALAALLVAVAAILAITGSGGGGDAKEEAASEPRIVSVAEVKALEGELGHPIYWVGKRLGEELELTREPDGSIFLRYMPEGTRAGDPHTYFLTVGTYPVANAQAALRRAAAETGVHVASMEGGAVTYVDPSARQSAYLAYPSSDLQIEVYDPVAGRSLTMLESGLIEPVG